MDPITGVRGQNYNMSTDESINDKRVNTTHKVTTDIDRCQVHLTDVQLEAL